MEEKYPIEVIKAFCKSLDWKQHTFPRINPEVWHKDTDITQNFQLNTEGVDGKLTKGIVKHILKRMKIEEELFLELIAKQLN